MVPDRIIGLINRGEQVSVLLVEQNASLALNRPITPT